MANERAMGNLMQRPWLPDACRQRGCTVRAQYAVHLIGYQVAHWCDGEASMAGVTIDTPDQFTPEVAAELARVAHLPEAPSETPAHGVRWLKPKTVDEILYGDG